MCPSVYGLQVGSPGRVCVGRSRCATVVIESHMKKASRFGETRGSGQVQRGHHGQDSIPRRSAECNQAGFFSLLASLLAT
jgi:hypothetical protein